MSGRRRYVAGACALGFLLLTVAVWARTPVVGLDVAVWKLSLRLRVDPLVSAARLVTAVLSPPVTAGALLLVAAVVSRRQGSLRPLLWAGAAAGAMAVLTRGVKMLVARPGPGSLDVSQVNGAYPSGHTASLVLGGGAVVLLLGLRRNRAAWLTFGGCVALVVTCLVYAHQHWLTDIVGSALTASGLLLCFDRGLSVPRRRAIPGPAATAGKVTLVEGNAP